MAKVKKTETRPPLNKIHKLEHQDWAKKYLKTDFLKVLWTDEMKATLDGLDGLAWGRITTGHRAPIQVRRQQGGGGVLVWAAIIKDELVGPFQVEDKLKSTPKPAASFWKISRKKSSAFKNAPSHASEYSTAWLASKGLKAFVI